MSSAVAAARLGDEIAHGMGVVAMIGGAILGAVVGAAIVAAAAVAAPLTIAVIVGGSIAIGALSMKQLVKGISTVFKLPEPTCGAVKVGSTNVSINGRPVARAGLDLSTPCSGMPMNHPPLPSDVMTADGSASVIVNGYPVARLKDKLTCGGHISSGSENVFIGGKTARMASVFDLEGWMETGFELLAGAALLGAGALAAAAGIGALAVFGAVVVGSNAALSGLGALGDRLGPGYGDLLQGAAGLGLLLAGPKLAKAPAAKAPPEKQYGVAFFGDNNLGYYTVDNAKIGAPGRKFFFMPLEDAAVVKNAADASKYTGRAPSADKAYREGGDIYGLSFPTEGMSIAKPTAADAGGWPHFLEGGHTAIKLGDGPNAGYLVNPTREFVIPGGNAVPEGSVLFKLGPKGEWIPIKKF